MISVIVPAYNAEHTLGLCIKALQMQTAGHENYEIIVVDDGSTDRTAEIAWEHAVRLVQQTNAGKGASRNAGSRVALGDLLLFTDADCAPSPEWVARMAEPFADPEVMGAKGVYETRQRELIPRFVQVEYEHKCTRMVGKDRIDFIDTYSAAYRRDVFMANGGFDPSYLGMEDQELSSRLARKGYRLVFVPQAVVLHQHVASVEEYWRRKLAIGRWKAVLLRWHPDRVVRDSHAPLTLRVQIGLLALLAPVAVVAAFWPSGRWGIAAMAAAFAVSAMPFLCRIARRDPAVLLVAPWLILVRGLALAAGLAKGFVQRPTGVGSRGPALGAMERAIKRTIDIVASALGLIATAPLVAALAIAVRADSPGPAMTSEERIGQHGRPFRALVLRTTAAQTVEPGGEPAEISAQAASADAPVAGPRVTRVGAFLCRWCLDELPQLWNVLCGQMSFVGPSPENPQVVRLHSDAQRERFAAKPGLTGPVRVSGRDDLPLDERVDLDVAYIKGYSLWSDLSILGRTVAAVLRGRGRC